LRDLKLQLIKKKNFSGDDVYENLHVTTKDGRGASFETHPCDISSLRIV